MKPTLALALAALAAAPAAAQAPNLIQLQATYERLCGATALANATTCDALARDLDAAVLVSGGSQGLERRIEIAKAHIAKIAAGDPDYANMEPEAARAVATQLTLLQPVFKGFGSMARFEHKGNENGIDHFVGYHPVGQVDWQVGVTSQGRLRAIAYKELPRLNAHRTLPAGRLTREDRAYPLAVGQRISGVFEDSDPKYGFGIWREDCYRIDVRPGQTLKLSVYADGYVVRSELKANCVTESGSFSLAHNDSSRAAFGHTFTTQRGAQYLLVAARVISNRPYQVYLEELSPVQVAQWRQNQQQAKINEQRQRDQAAADRQAMFGAVVRGLAMGVSGIDAPLMNPDGSAPNTLDVLNAANAELARQNAQSKAELDWRIAEAQRQAERGRRETERAEAERQAARAQQAQAPARPPANGGAIVVSQTPPKAAAPVASPSAPPTSAAQPPRPVQQAQATTPQMCTEPGSTREWRPASATLTLADVTAEYNEARARPCAGGGGSISPMQCDKQTTAFGVAMAGACKATISCPARQVRCSSRVTGQ